MLRDRPSQRVVGRSRSSPMWWRSLELRRPNPDALGRLVRQPQSEQAPRAVLLHLSQSHASPTRRRVAGSRWSVRKPFQFAKNDTGQCDRRTPEDRALHAVPAVATGLGHRVRWVASTRDRWQCRSLSPVDQMVVSAPSGVGADTTDVLTTAALTGRDLGAIRPLLPITVTDRSGFVR